MSAISDTPHEVRVSRVIWEIAEKRLNAIGLTLNTTNAAQKSAIEEIRTAIDEVYKAEIYRKVLFNLRSTVAYLQPVMSSVSDDQRRVVTEIVESLSEAAGRLEALAPDADHPAALTRSRSTHGSLRCDRGAARKAALAACLFALESAASQIRSWLDSNDDSKPSQTGKGSL